MLDNFINLSKGSIYQKIGSAKDLGDILRPGLSQILEKYLHGHAESESFSWNPSMVAVIVCVSDIVTSLLCNKIMSQSMH